LLLPLSRFLFLVAFVFVIIIIIMSSADSATTAARPIQHTTRPIVTGTSVLGIVYQGGVMLAADTLLSYGGMAKHQGVSRMHHITNTGTIIAASGEYSDFQMLCQLLEQKALEETCTSAVLMDSLYADHSASMSASAVWNYLRFILYQKRNKFNPYWNDILVAGLDAATAQPFLASVDKIGTTVKDNVLATGFGSYLALPLLREKWRPGLTEGEARAILEDCLKVLFYRDCRASSLIQLAKCGGGGAAETPLISDPYQLETSWSDPAFVNAAPAQIDGDGGW
jgi:20S proteasome subunit beta 7